MKHVHPVGRLTLGLILIALGLVLTWNLYADSPVLHPVSYWPVILVLLGLEMIWAQRKAQAVRVDAFPLVSLTLILIIAVWVQGIPLTRSDAHRYVMETHWSPQSHPVPSVVDTIKIDNITGEVIIEPSPSRELVVEAHVEVRGPTESTVVQLVENAALEVTQRNSVIEVRLHRHYLHHMPNFSIVGKLRVQVPRGLDLVVDTVTARVVLDDHQGKAKISTRTGSVAVHSIEGPLTIHTSTGQVSVTRLSGPLNLSTSTGRVTLAELDGDAQVQTSTGQVTAHHVTGPLMIRTSTGNVEATGIRGALRVDTTTGRVAVVDPQDTVEANTTTGSIRVETSQGPQANWELRSRTGGISLAFPREATVNLRAQGRSVSANLPGLSVTSGSAHTAVNNDGPYLWAMSQTGTVTITGR